MITTSGRHIQITEKRHCLKCGNFTEELWRKIRYQDNPEQAGTMIKKNYWVCSMCLTETEEIKNQQIPDYNLRIINRLLRMQEDYVIQALNISSLPEKLVVEITVKN